MKLVSANEWNLNILESSNVLDIASIYNYTWSARDMNHED